ncbi:MAG: hypothetical protein GXO79_15605 [Chlorobi bacterium]|nr:hypothetical protein [Chlorobiota bacterium]
MNKRVNLFNELNWEDAEGYPQGTKKKTLRDENSAKTILLRLPPGFSMEPHSHLTTEQHFVLEGEYESKGEIFTSGSYQIFYSGEEHGPYKSKNGALILVIWDPYKIISE